MKAALLIWTSCFFVFDCQLQEPYMYLRHGRSVNSYEGSRFVGEVDGNYVAIGWTHKFLGDLDAITYKVVDKNGNLLINTVFENDTVANRSGSYGSGFYFNNHIIVGSSSNPLGENFNATIYKFNPQGDAEVLSIIDRDSSTHFNQGKKTVDNNFIFIGYSREFDTAGDYYVVKTDTLGNILWERRYGTNYYDNGLSITPTPDGGYLLFGSSAGYGEKIYLETDGLLIKIDDNGSEEWRTNWGGLYSDCNWSVDVAPNGDIVAGGCIADEFAGAFDAYIRKMDQNGHLLWDTIFDYDTINYAAPKVFYKIQFTMDDKIIAAGSGYTYINDSTAHTAPWLVIFDLDGTVLSNRGYTSFFSGPTSRAWFEDIRPTKDGGYIAGGQYLPAAGDTGNQDMFVLKLDSAGCEYPQCQPPLGIHTPTQESVDFTAYPNPFGSSIIFNVDNEMVEEIIITDIRGVLIDRIVMGENQQQIEWQAQVHAQGIYIAVAHGAGQSKALKIIKY